MVDGFELGDSSVTFKLIEDFVAQSVIILVFHGLEQRLVRLVVALEAFQVSDEFVLLLRNPVVMQSMVVAFFLHFHVLLFGLLGSCLVAVDFELKEFHLVVELLVARVQVRHEASVLGLQFASLNRLVPLVLKAVERFEKIQSDQKVAEKVVSNFGLGGQFSSRNGVKLKQTTPEFSPPAARGQASMVVILGLPSACLWWRLRFC